MPYTSRRATLAFSFLVAGTACSPDDHGEASESPPPEKYLGLAVPKAGDGLQVRSRGVDVPAGEDVEYCEVAELPGEPQDLYYVDGIEFGNAEYSHHLIIEMAPDGTAAARALAERELGERVPCLTVQSEYGDGFQFLGLAQTPYRSWEYPSGVGRVFHGKQRFVFDYHYFNVSPDVVQARSAINFHLAEAERVEHIAQLFGFVNATIDTPPGASRSFTGECRSTRDMNVLEISRHTHRWGTTFEAWFAGGPRDGEQVFSSPSYEEGVDRVFDEPVSVKAGEGFRFRCDFENTTSHSLRYGPNATDEMCTLFGLWWSEDSGEVATEGCTLTQVGADGIARPIDASAFPDPTAEESETCLDIVDGNGAEPEPVSECTRCACEKCPGLLNRCMADADCREILSCVGRTRCRGDACITTCATEFNEHSTGVGLLVQAAECNEALCAACASP